MKCPVCIEKGLKSSVYPGGGSCTAMYCAPYYDKDGKYHNHDMNTSTFGYSCSRGHRWSVSSNGSCPSCDFGHNSERISIISDEEIKPVPIKSLSGSFSITSGTGTLTMTIPGFGSNPISIITFNGDEENL